MLFIPDHISLGYARFFAFSVDMIAVCSHYFEDFPGFMVRKR